MTGLKESELRKKYNIDFNKIKEALENATVSPDFWKKQAAKNAKAMRKAKAERLSMIPSWEHTQRVFGRLKGE